CAFHRKKFKEDLFTSGIKHGILQDSFEPSNDNPNVANALREPFIVNQDPGKNSSQSPPQINHHCCYGCGDPLEVPIIPNPEPFNNKTIKELPSTVQSFDPKSDLVYNSPNVFDPPPVTHEAYKCQPKNLDYYNEQNSCYDPNSFGYDQFQPQQYTVNHHVFNVQNELFDSQNKLMEQFTSMCDMVGQFIQKKEEETKIEEEQAANARYWKIPACYNDDNDDYAFASIPNEPVNSLGMGDEHLDTISATESDEFIKSSIENLVSILSESKGEPECDMPVCEEFTTFSNILFDAEYEFDSSDDQSFSDEDVPMKIFSNPLFDEEIIPMKIDQHHYNVESDLIEYLRTHDSSIIISSKIDSLLDEFADELTILKSISPGIDETDYDPKEEICLIERVLYDNSSPHPLKEFVSANSDAEIESFSPSPIPVEDSDSLMEEIDLSFTSDYLMPPSIEDDDYDSERDILILKDLLSNDTLSLPEIESFHFDIPSFSRLPAKPPDGPRVPILVSVRCQKPGHFAARLGCAETKVVTWDDLVFKLITLGWNVKHEIFCKNVDPKLNFESSTFTLMNNCRE
nr:hypothetical protein [Tanacetum cinerariifolium]